MPTFLSSVKRYWNPPRSRPPKDEPQHHNAAASRQKRTYTPYYAERAMAHSLPLADRPDVQAKRKSVCAEMGLNPVVNERGNAHLNSLLCNAANHTERYSVATGQVSDSIASRAWAAEHGSVDVAESSARAYFRGQMMHDEEMRRRLRQNMQMQAAGPGKSYSSSSSSSSAAVVERSSLKPSSSHRRRSSSRRKSAVVSPPKRQSVRFEDQVERGAATPLPAHTEHPARHDSHQSSDQEYDSVEQRAVTLALLEGQIPKAMALAQLEGNYTACALDVLAAAAQKKIDAEKASKAKKLNGFRAQNFDMAATLDASPIEARVEVPPSSSAWLTTTTTTRTTDESDWSSEVEAEFAKL